MSEVLLNSETLDNLERRVNRASSMMNLAVEESTRLHKEVGLAKGRLELEEEVTPFIEEAERRLHEQTVGRYERLLTGIFSDVFPEGDRIKINVTTKRGLAAIDFQLITPEGFPEDVMNGRGGAVVNVLSIGLRFIALSQTKLRPFIVLDEADCWITSSRIPLVARVIHTLSRDIGIQTLIISHNDPAAFSDNALMVYMSNNGDRAEVEASHQEEWAEDDIGIRSIHFKDVMSHQSTEIPLSKGVTVIVGDNDIGKSAIITGIRALCYNEGNDTLIRHRASGCMVSMNLGPEGILSYERRLKGAKKTRYALVDSATKEILHETEEAATPQWLKDLGFSMYEDMDIQIGHQKKPIFLLDLPDTKRAVFLSVGSEASWISAMRSNYLSQVKADKATVKEGERRLQVLQEKLDCEDRVALLVETSQRLFTDYRSLEKVQANIKQLSANIAELTHLEPVTRINPIPACDMPELVPMYQIEHMQQVMSDLTTLYPFTHLDSVPAIETPDLVDTQRMSDLYRILADDRIMSLDKIEPVVVPDLINTDVMAAHYETLNRDSVAVEQAQALYQGVTAIEVPELIDTDNMGQMGRDIQAQHRVIRQADEIMAGIHDIETPELTDISTLATSIRSLEDDEKALNALEAELKQIEQEKSRVKAQWDALLEETGGSCPTCHQPWAGEHTLVGVHAHDH